MAEAQDVDMENGDSGSRGVRERAPVLSPPKSESSQPLRKSVLRVCEQDNNDQADVSKVPRLGAVAGTSSNAEETKSEKKGNIQNFVEALELRFKDRCEVGLRLDDRTSRQALQLFRDSKPLLLANVGTIGTGTVEETERLWSACILYVVKRLNSGTSDGAGTVEDCSVEFTLSQLLRVTKFSVVEFFKELPQFLAKAGPTVKSLYGDNWEKRLQVKEVQADFVHLMVLYNYYKRVYQDLFLAPRPPTTSANGSTSEGSGELPHPMPMRFGWMLFLALRVHVLSPFTDLVTCTNGLLAVIIVLIIHTPLSLRRFSFEDTVKFAKRSSDRVSLIRSLCNLYHASEDDVTSMVEKLNSMIRDLLKKPSTDPSTCSNSPQVAGVSLDGLAYFEGLMEDELIEANFGVLEKDYDEAYRTRGELDERMFINGEDSLIGAISSGGTPSVSGTKLQRKHDSMSSPVRGPAVSSGASPSSPCSSPCSSPVKTGGLMATNGSKPPPTPVSITMTTAKWLRTVIAPLPAEPSADLQLFFRSCDRDISSDVGHRAIVLLDGIFPSNGAGNCQGARGGGLMDSLWAEQRRLEALKLYYKVLGAMCRAESQRLHSNNLLFLPNERFHRCMIACSAELVLATHKTVTMTFPAVLEPSGITAFDLSKVIESFVQHEETLPRELKRHLNSIEERLLESMAWEKGSSMYNSLIVAKPKLAEEISRMNLMADPMPSLDNLSLHPRPSLASNQHLPGSSRHDNLAGEMSKNPSSPSKQGATPPGDANGSVAAGGIEQAVPASFMSPVRERPSAFSAFSSPLKSRLMTPLQLAFVSPQRPNPYAGGETCVETCINVFFQKVMKLAAVRIRNLCERLRQSHQIVEQVYRALQHILNHETSLFFNRHIDQLILCSLYGVCKVSRVNVTFRDIIYHYRKQPQCKPYVFRNVFIDLPPVRRAGKAGGQETGDIIKFYNEVFVPSTKSFLLHVGSNTVTAAPNNNHVSDEGNQGEAQAPGSPGASTFPTLPDMSPKKVSASHNVYVSPLRSTKVDSLMSPHTRSLYACVGESTHAYQSPSKDLTAINNRLNNRRRCRLDFGDATLVTDSAVVDALYPLNNNTNQQGIRLTADSTLSPQSWSASKRQRPDR